MRKRRRSCALDIALMLSLILAAPSTASPSCPDRARRRVRRQRALSSKTSEITTGSRACPSRSSFAARWSTTCRLSTTRSCPCARRSASGRIWSFVASGGGTRPYDDAPGGLVGTYAGGARGGCGSRSPPRARRSCAFSCAFAVCMALAGGGAAGDGRCGEARAGCCHGGRGYLRGERRHRGCERRRRDARRLHRFPRKSKSAPNSASSAERGALRDEVKLFQRCLRQIDRLAPAPPPTYVAPPPLSLAQFSSLHCVPTRRFTPRRAKPPRGPPSHRRALVCAGSRHGAPSVQVLQVSEE